MSTMSASYRSKPSEIWATNLEALASTTFLLVCRHGPTVFSVKSQATGDVNKVVLGSPHKCTCKQEFCLHSLFCLTKVLKLPQTHPFCYQVGLTDNEMIQVLDGSCITQAKRLSTKEYIKQVSNGTSSSATLEVFGIEADPGKVPRIAVEPGDTCPICYNDMDVEMLGLTWCRSGCGRSLHGVCMIDYIDFQISNRKPISCPLCRDSDFSISIIHRDIEAGKIAMKKKSKSKGKEITMTLPIQCSSCKCMLRSGVFFRCLECSHHLKKAATSASANSLINAALNQKVPQDFCVQCFTNISNNLHLSHHFVSSDTAIQDVDDVTWSVARHPQTGGQDDNEARKAAREEILSTIRNRELTMDDYEMLLALDATPSQATLATVCISSLPLYNHSESSSQGMASRLLCWCCDRRNTVHVNTTTELYAHIRVLPCGHLAHDKCMNGELEIFLSNEEACNTLSEYRCSHIECGAVLFPGLRRHKKKKRTASESAAAVAEAAGPHEKAEPAGNATASTLTGGLMGSSLTFGLVGSALGSTSSMGGTTTGAASAAGTGAVVRQRRTSVERGGVMSEGPNTTISQMSSRTNGGLQDMFVSSIGCGASTTSDNSGVGYRNRSPSPGGGGLVLGSNSRRLMNQNSLDDGGSMSGRFTASSDVSRHAANTDVNAAVVLTSRSIGGGAAASGCGDSITVRNRRASSEGIDPLVYRTVNHEYNMPPSEAGGGGGGPVGAIRLKKPPRKKPDMRLNGAGGNGMPSDLSFAQSLLTVNPIATGQQSPSIASYTAAMAAAAAASEDGSVIAGGGVVSAVTPPRPPVQRDPTVSAKNKVSAILSRRLRSTEPTSGSAPAASGGEETPSFDDLAITNSSTSSHVRQDSNGSSNGSSVLPPRRSPLVVLPSTNSGRLRPSGGTAATGATTAPTTAVPTGVNVLTDGETSGPRRQRSGSAVDGLTEPDVLSNLLSINSAVGATTATVNNSQSTGNLQTSGSTSSLGNRFNEIRTKPPVKGKIVKGFSLSTRISNMNDESDGEA